MVSSLRSPPYPNIGLKVSSHPPQELRPRRILFPTFRFLIWKMGPWLDGSCIRSSSERWFPRNTLRRLDVPGKVLGRLQGLLHGSWHL